MKRFLGALLLAILLPSCAALTAVTNGSIKNVSPRQVYELKSAYAIARVPAVAYRSLPWCAVHPAPCQTSAASIQIKKADKLALGALGRLEVLSDQHNTLDIGGAYAAAQAAVATAEEIAAAYAKK